MSSTPALPPSSAVDPYRLRGDGIFVPPVTVVHRDDAYDSEGFGTMSRIQRHHFWYRGRHRFLLRAVHRYVVGDRPYRVVDLGGGCGGWVAYLRRHGRFSISELAVADSSEAALHFAAQALPEGASRYQIDLLNLQWQDRWDVAFLLDVLEHIPDHEAALGQVRRALAPGAFLFVTVPALDALWTWNDELAHHQRRYRRQDFRLLADHCGYQLVDARYFMFLLSPLLLASRVITGPKVGAMTAEQRWQLSTKMHEVPRPWVNGLLAAIFAAETPLGHHVPFPWGTSLLAVLQKTASTSASPTGSKVLWSGR